MQTIIVATTDLTAKPPGIERSKGKPQRCTVEPDDRELG